PRRPLSPRAPAARRQALLAHWRSSLSPHVPSRAASQGDAAVVNGTWGFGLGGRPRSSGPQSRQRRSVGESEAEEFAPQRVFVKLLLVDRYPLHLILVETCGFPLVKLGDIVVAGGERLLLADGLHPLVDRSLVGRLQF